MAAKTDGARTPWLMRRKLDCADQSIVTPGRAHFVGGHPGGIAPAHKLGSPSGWPRECGNSLEMLRRRAILGPDDGLGDDLATNTVEEMNQSAKIASGHRKHERQLCRTVARSRSCSHTNNTSRLV